MSGTYQAPDPATAVVHHVPRGAILGAGGLVAFAILAAAAGRIGGLAPSEVPVSTPVESRALLFEDRADGAVVVRGAAPGDGGEVAVLDPGTNGFVRGVMRGLARDRRIHERDADRGTPFVLTRWADGRLSLGDEATGRSIELESFGPTNAAAFARLLPDGDGGSVQR